MSSASNDNLVSSFPVCMSFISFSFLIAVTRSSSTMLNTSEETGHLCPIPHLREKAFSFSLLNMMLALGLSYSVYYVELCSLCAHFLKSF